MSALIIHLIFKHAKSLPSGIAVLLKGYRYPLLAILQAFDGQEKILTMICLRQIMYTGSGHLIPKLSTHGAQIKKLVAFCLFWREAAA